MVPNIRQLQAPSHVIHYWEQATYRRISQCGMCVLVPKLLEYNHTIGANVNIVWSYVIILCKLFTVLLNPLTRISQKTGWLFVKTHDLYKSHPS